MFNTKKPISGEEEALLLDGRRLPARLTSAEVAVVLGIHEHDIAQLVASKMLTPLGKPAHNSPKYFAAVDIIEAAQKPRMALHGFPPNLPLLAEQE
jgi:hypothetical protein